MSHPTASGTARFVPALCERAKFVHMVIQPELRRLFNNMFVHIPNINIIPQPAPFPAADAWTTFVSLPYNLKLNDEQIRTATFESVSGGMPFILSGLKSVIETGSPLVTQEAVAAPA